MFPVDNNVQRSLHAFEAHDEPWGIYTMGSNGEWDAYAKRCSDHKLAQVAAHHGVNGTNAVPFNLYKPAFCVPTQSPPWWSL